jgi:hypothetical protein
MKSIIILLLILFTFACSSTKVILNVRYLEEDETLAIKEKLEEVGYTVETNTFYFPKSVDRSTIIYSLFVKDINAVDILLNELSALGWDIKSVRPMMSDNHSFKKDSIGVYLIPDDVQPQARTEERDLVNEYSSRNCEFDAHISLSKDNTFEINIAEEENREHILIKGIWLVRSYPVIELRPVGYKYMYFQIDKKQETDKVSDIEIIELNPLDTYEIFPNCSFAYGLRI